MSCFVESCGICHCLVNRSLAMMIKTENKKQYFIMAELKLTRRPFVKNILGDSSSWIDPAYRRIRGAGRSPLPVIFQSSRSACHDKTAPVLGVQVAHVLDLPVVQQPQGDDGYVSPLDGQITEFRIPSKFGNVGLLAHNDLSGRLFSRLLRGQDVHLLYGNHRIETFVVRDILRYQALRPDDPYSSFRDLGTDETLTAVQLFAKAYTGSRHVTFQTCITPQDSPAWGRLFVIATHTHLSESHPWN
jgi:hypothetical protein